MADGRLKLGTKFLKIGSLYLRIGPAPSVGADTHLLVMTDSDWWSYDIAGDTWTQLSEIDVGVFNGYGILARHGSSGVVAGLGFDGSGYLVEDVTPNSGVSDVSYGELSASFNISAHQYDPNGRLWQLAYDGTTTPVNTVCYLYFSDDDGATSTQSLQLPSGYNPRWIACHPTDANRVAASVQKISDSSMHVWVTTNGGTSWTHRTVGESITPVDQIRAGRLIWSHGNIVIIYDKATGAKAYVNASADDGATWGNEQQIGANLSGTIDLVRMANDDAFITIFFNTPEVYRSTDGGLTWALVTLTSQLFDPASAPTGDDLYMFDIDDGTLSVILGAGTGGTTETVLTALPYGYASTFPVTAIP